MEDETKIRVTGPKPGFPPTSQACLVHVYPPGPSLGVRYELGDAPIIIGREDTCDICISDDSVSRRHVCIKRSATGHAILDMQSTNGTFVNDVRVSSGELKSGDSLSIGGGIYRFLAGSNSDAAYEQEVHRLEVVDALTDVYNNRHCLDFLAKALSSSAQYVRPLAVVMMEIDRFNEVSSKLGRLGGQAIMRQLAATLKRDLQNEHFLARQGVAGFLIVFPESGREVAAQVAHRLRDEAEKQVFEFAGHTYHVKLNIGIAAITGAEWTAAAELISQAHEDLAGRRQQVLLGTSDLGGLGEDYHRASKGWSPAVTLTEFDPSLLETFSSQSVIVHYPAPIATAYRRYCQERHPTDRLLKLFSAAEALLRYLATLALSDLFASFSRDSQLGLPDHPAFYFLQRPRPMTLGRWVECLRETARHLENQDRRFFLELPETCAPGSQLQRIFEEIVQARNRCAHQPGAVSSPAMEATALEPKVRAMLDQALHSVYWLRRYPLGFARRAWGEAGAAGKRRYYFHSCMGARVTDTDQASGAEVAVQVVEEFPFVVASSGRQLLYLWPWLRARLSPLANRYTLYVFERMPEDSWPFLTQVEWAAIDLHETWRERLADQPRASHEWLRDRLATLPAIQSVPAELKLHQVLKPTRRGRLVGERLSNGIRLSAAVAAGGFGTIYAAKTSDGKRVAVKVLELPDVEGELKRFHQEFDKLKVAGQHVGIIRCYDQGIELVKGREYPWYSMDFAVGDLSGRIEDRRHPDEAGLPWDDPAQQQALIEEFRCITGAVAHLHDLDIVHRDIKPGNVLVMENGELRLSDFGLVKNLAPSEDSIRQMPSSSAGGVKGTQAYMAPEQARGERVDKRADVYSLAVLFAELATGERPDHDPRCTHESPLRRMPNILRLPRGLQHLLFRCTDVEPEQRPPDAHALLRLFEEAMLKVILQGALARNEGQEGMVPEKCAGDVMDNLKVALTDAGRPDLYQKLDRAIVNREQNKKRGMSEADAMNLFLHEVMGYVQPKPNPPAK